MHILQQQYKDHQEVRFHIYNILPRHYLPKREVNSTGKTTLREQVSQSIFSKFFLRLEKSTTA